MIEINHNPSRRELLWFGVSLVLFALVLGLVVRFQFGLPAASRWIWGTGAGLTLVHFAVPPFRRPFYLAWMYAAFPIGWLISHLALGLIYYLVMTPIGLLRRAFGSDAMNRKFDRTATTYWEPHQPAEKKRYFKQF